MTPEQEAALEFHMIEMDVEISNYEKWLTRVEKIVGHDLDGDQQEDGYSLDGALDAYDEGLSPRQYAETIPKKGTPR